MKDKISLRVFKAEKNARPIISMYDKMTLEEKLKYMKENRTQHKHNQNIINRYYNLFARQEGYARGLSQATKELKEKTRTRV